MYSFIVTRYSHMFAYNACVLFETVAKHSLTD